MKKVGILTFHWADDYGAMLQAYALKTKISSMGHDCSLIPYAPNKFVGRYWILPYEPYEGKGGKLSIKSFGRGKSRFKYNIKHFCEYSSRRKAMRKFRNKYLISQKAIKHSAKIHLDEYSAVFVGSDQVWNPKLTIGFDEAYSGVIDHGKCRVVSYGASFGSGRLDEKYSTDFSNLLNQFDSISVREKSAIDYINEFGREADCVLDPTLLLTTGEWTSVAATSDESGYILIYDTAPIEKLQRYAQKLSQETGKRVIRISSILMRTAMKVEGFDFRPSVGPDAFLRLFMNADYVVTNSFHGTAMSVIFNKKFLVYGFKERSARMIDFLESIGLSDRFVEEAKEENLIYQDIDWDKINSRIEELRKDSLAFLTKNIELSNE